MTDPAPPPARPKAGSFLPILLALLLVGAAGGYYAYVRHSEGNVPPVDELESLRPLVAPFAKPQTLDPRYADADGDLVADAPTDPAKLRDPAELRVVGVPSDYAADPDAGRAVWKDFLAALSKATGKPAVFAADVTTTEAQLAAVRAGTLHVTAFPTGLVPTAVNTAGFVPLACPADANKHFSYSAVVVVRADGPVKELADLRGKSVAFSALSSNSGARVPMVELKERAGLLPGRDYKYVMTGDQARSVADLAAGRYDAACAASDLFARTLADPKRNLKPEQFRAVLTSEAFPPLCFGVPHDLRPELVARIKGVFADFALPGSSLAGKYREARFAPVDYKLNWASVVRVDAAFGRLLDGR